LTENQTQGAVEELTTVITKQNPKSATACQHGEIAAQLSHLPSTLGCFESMSKVPSANVLQLPVIQTTTNKQHCLSFFTSDAFMLLCWGRHVFVPTQPLRGDHRCTSFQLRCNSSNFMTNMLRSCALQETGSSRGAAATEKGRRRINDHQDSHRLLLCSTSSMLTLNPMTLNPLTFYIQSQLKRKLKRSFLLESASLVCCDPPTTSYKVPLAFFLNS
jgi:hypothetical protein